MNRIKYILIVVLLIIVLFECYHYFDNGGNVIVYLQNQSGYKNENVDYSIGFNDRLLFEGIFDGHETVPLGPIVENCFSRNTIRVSSKEQNVNISKNISAFPVKWLVINYYEDSVDIKTSIFPVILQ